MAQGERRAENALRQAFAVTVLRDRVKHVPLDVALDWSMTQSDRELLSHRGIGRASLRHIRGLTDAGARPLRDGPDVEEPVPPWTRARIPTPDDSAALAKGYAAWQRRHQRPGHDLPDETISLEFDEGDVRPARRVKVE